MRLKIVIRCADFEKSLDFYTRVLGFCILEQWQEEQGRAAILGLDEAGIGGIVEIYQMSPADARFDEVFTRPFSNDKIDLQIRTDFLDGWIDLLKDLWPYEGPEDLPWRQRWIKLRDPDHLLVAVYQEV